MDGEKSSSLDGLKNLKSDNMEKIPFHKLFFRICNMDKKIENVVFNQIINDHLKPNIRQIDEKAYYPKEFLNAVG
ncbi:hypothetical protein KW850_31600, partial [Bacillus sp. sid0103]|uniref:hypothetical protein n=1 Tax=Bacillus sp. sid0103 TaxID=2856337 RepID=UPI002A0ACC9B|nr:hypothetical protein [Bacillus sp. sid0103]